MLFGDFSAWSQIDSDPNRYLVLSGGGSVAAAAASVGLCLRAEVGLRNGKGHHPLPLPGEGQIGSRRKQKEAEHILAAFQDKLLWISWIARLSLSPDRAAELREPCERDREQEKTEALGDPGPCGQCQARSALRQSLGQDPRRWKQTTVRLVRLYTHNTFLWAQLHALHELSKSKYELLWTHASRKGLNFEHFPLQVLETKVHHWKTKDLCGHAWPTFPQCCWPHGTGGRRWTTPVHWKVYLRAALHSLHSWKVFVESGIIWWIHAF